MVIGATKSVCPVCLKVIQAKKVMTEDGIYLKKACDKHGDFRVLIWEGSYLEYDAWKTENRAQDPPVDGKKVRKGCPYDCGLCQDHLRKGCCVLLELTKRCNLHCPTCFASAGDAAGSDLTIEEIEKQYEYLMAHGGPFNIQLSGGEPTVRDDLPEIIRLGREKGFSFFQLNTNGIRLAEEPSYARELKEAGLNTVFLQFDGLTDEVYERLRGRALLDLKMKAIENCKEAKLGVTLVPVIAPGVNENQIGELLTFAMSRMPYVRGIHFQPMSYFGRNKEENTEFRITIPRMLRAIEAQTKGLMKAGDFTGGGAEHSYCSFHASYRLREDGSLKLLKQRNDGCCCNTSSDDSRKFVEDQWSFEAAHDFSESEMTETDALDRFLEEIHRTRFSVSGMLFQDAWNLDLDRVRQCHILESDSRYGMVPFCMYNLTDHKGKYLYR